MTSSEAVAPVWIFARGLLGAVATLSVWLCLLTQIIAVDTLLAPLAPEDGFRCGQLAMSFLLFASILWIAVLPVLSYDVFRMRRGKLSLPLKWLRTVPALLTVLIPPTFLLFSWVSTNW